MKILLYADGCVNRDASHAGRLTGAMVSRLMADAVARIEAAVF